MYSYYKIIGRKTRDRRIDEETTGRENEGQLFHPSRMTETRQDEVPLTCLSATSNPTERTCGHYLQQ